MNIAQRYRTEIMKQLLKKYLLGGQVPSPEELLAQYKRLMDQYPQIGNRSLISQSADDLVPRSEIKLENFQSVVIGAKLDLKVLRDQLIDVYEQTLNQTAMWRAYHQAAEARLTELNDDLDLRLFLNHDSEGYFSFVRDDFLSLENVNLDLTTADVITGAGIVKIGDSRTRTYRHKFDPSTATSTFAGTVGRNRTSISTVTGTDIRNILREDSEGWIGSANSHSPGTGELTIKVRLSDSIEVSRIDFRRLRTDNGAGTITAYYSSDRVNWGQFGSTRSLSDSLIFINEPVQIKELRFQLIKTDYDNHRPDTGYFYYFDCKEVALYNETTDYTEETDNELYSIGYSVAPYNKAAIEVCDINTADTSVKYFLSKDNESWYPINPTTKAPGAIDYVVNFSGTTSQVNQSSDTDRLLVDTLDSQLLTLPSQYPSISVPVSGIALVNYKIPQSEVADVPRSSIKVFKDWTNERSPDEIRGWTEGDSLETTFYVDNPEPLQLDFGRATVTLDGRERTGRVEIRGIGWHTISIPRSTYSFSQGNANSLRELQSYDALYPYNGKHLIEGYEYGATYSGPDLYNGFSMRAARELRRARSFQDFLDNRSTTYYVSFDVDGDMLFMVERPTDASLLTKQKYYISYNRNEESFNNIYLKAVLNSVNEAVTPILVNYTIKMGY